MNPIDDGGPAFPQSVAVTPDGGRVCSYDFEAGTGFSQRDWFATFAPEPTQEQIRRLVEADWAANPHADAHKPKRRSVAEIVSDLRFAYADAMIAASTRKPRL